MNIRTKNKLILFSVILLFSTNTINVYSKSPKDFSTFEKSELDDIESYKYQAKSKYDKNNYVQFSDEFFVTIANDGTPVNFSIKQYFNVDWSTALKNNWNNNKIFCYVNHANFTELNNTIIRNISCYLDLRNNTMTISFDTINEIKNGHIANKNGKIKIDGTPKNTYHLEFIITPENYNTFKEILKSDSVSGVCNGKKRNLNKDEIVFLNKYLDFYPYMQTAYEIYKSNKELEQLKKDQELQQYYYAQGFLAGQKKYSQVSKLYCYADSWGEPIELVSSYRDGYKAGHDIYLSTIDKSKFTEKEYTAIVSESIFIGMSADALVASLGSPDNINRTVIANTITEQYVYKNNEYIYVFLQ